MHAACFGIDQLWQGIYVGGTQLGEFTKSEDIFHNRALVRVQEAIRTHRLKSRMIMQVHDELVFDAVREEVDELKALVIEGMQGALPLPNDVPVVAEAGVGDNWLEAH